MTRLRIAAAAAGLVVVSGCALSLPSDIGVLAAASTPATAPVLPVADEATQVPTDSSHPDLEALISSLTVLDALPDVPGYERSCSPDDGCVFGPAWTDASSAPLARNGCDTRNDVLALDLIDVQFKPGTGDCKVVSGTLPDPYTGRNIAFVAGRSTSSEVQIDHVYPLSRAWDAGAAQWSQDRRVTFANDADLNLRATDGPTNSSKSDSGPDTWLPPNAAYQCEYSTGYLRVAAAYGLAVTADDIDVTRAVCG